MKKEEDDDENKIIKFVQSKGDDDVIGFSLSTFFHSLRYELSTAKKVKDDFFRDIRAID